MGVIPAGQTGGAGVEGASRAVTDKLADGIRKFAADQRKLEALLAAKLG